MTKVARPVGVLGLEDPLYGFFHKLLSRETHVSHSESVGGETGRVCHGRKDLQRRLHGHQ